MFHRFFTIEQLSKYLRIATIISIVSLLALLFQTHFESHFKIIEIIINLVHYASFFVVTFISIFQMLMIFRKKYQKFIEKHNIIAININILLTTIFLWIFTTVHHIKSSFIEFYNNETIPSNHSKKVIYLLIFITLMLIYDLYESIKKYNKIINDKTIKEIIFTESYTFIREYLIIITALIGFLNFQTLQQFSLLTSKYMYLKLVIYSDIFGYIMLIIWIIIPLYFLYNHYFKRKN